MINRKAVFYIDLINKMLAKLNISQIYLMQSQHVVAILEESNLEIKVIIIVGFRKLRAKD